MSVIIRLQGLPWSASAMNIRHFFSGLSIPAGGVHIIGGDGGDAFIAFSSDDDARVAMKKNLAPLNGTPVQLFLSSKSEMQSVIDAARQGSAPANSAPTSGIVSGGLPGNQGSTQQLQQSIQDRPFQNMPSNFPLGNQNQNNAGTGVGTQQGNNFNAQMPNQFTRNEDWQGFQMYGEGEQNQQQPMASQFQQNQRMMGNQTENRFPSGQGGTDMSSGQFGPGHQMGKRFQAGNQQFPDVTNQMQQSQMMMGAGGITTQSSVLTGQRQINQGNQKQDFFSDQMAARAGNILASLGHGEGDKLHVAGVQGNVSAMGRALGGFPGQMGAGPNRENFQNMMSGRPGSGKSQAQTNLPGNRNSMNEGIMGGVNIGGDNFQAGGIKPGSNDEKKGNRFSNDQKGGMGQDGTQHDMMQWSNDAMHNIRHPSNQKPLDMDARPDASVMINRESVTGSDMRGFSKFPFGGESKEDSLKRMTHSAERNVLSADQAQQPLLGRESPHPGQEMRLGNRFSSDPDQGRRFPPDRFPERRMDMLGDDRRQNADEALPSTRYPPDDEAMMGPETRVQPPDGRGPGGFLARGRPEDPNLFEKRQFPPGDRRFPSEGRMGPSRDQGQYPEGEQFPDVSRNFPPSMRGLPEDGRFDDRGIPPDERRPMHEDRRFPLGPDGGRFRPHEGKFPPEDRMGITPSRPRPDDFIGRGSGENPFPPEDVRFREREEEIRRREAFEKGRHGPDDRFMPESFRNDLHPGFRDEVGRFMPASRRFPPERGFEGENEEIDFAGHHGERPWERDVEGNIPRRRGPRGALLDNPVIEETMDMDQRAGAGREFEGMKGPESESLRRPGFEGGGGPGFDGRVRPGFGGRGGPPFEGRGGPPFEGRGGPPFEGRGVGFEPRGGPGFEARGGPGGRGGEQEAVRVPEAGRGGAGIEGIRGRGMEGVRGRGMDGMRGRGMDHRAPGVQGPGSGRPGMMNLAEENSFDYEHGSVGHSRPGGGVLSDEDYYGGPHDFDSRFPGPPGRGGMFDRPPRGRGDPFSRGRPVPPFGRSQGMDVDRRIEDVGAEGRLNMDMDARNMSGRSEGPLSRPPIGEQKPDFSIKPGSGKGLLGDAPILDPATNRGSQKKPDMDVKSAETSRRDIENRGTRRSNDRDRDRDRRSSDRRGRDRDDYRSSDRDRSRYRYERDRSDRRRSRSRDRSSRDKDGRRSRDHSTAKPDSPRRGEQRTRNIHIKNMPSTVSYKDVRRFLQPIEVPFDGLKMVNDEQGQRTGEAYVQFRRTDDSIRALRRNGEKFNGQTISISHCSDDQYSKAVDSFLPKKKEEAPPSSTGNESGKNSDKLRYVVELKNLPLNITKQDIVQFFKGLTIENNGEAAYIEFDLSGIATGNGFVEFKSDFDYKKALTQDGSLLGTVSVRVLPGKKEDADSLKSKQTEMFQRAALRSVAGSRIMQPRQQNPTVRSGLMGPRPNPPPASQSVQPSPAAQANRAPTPSAQANRAPTPSAQDNSQQSQDTVCVHIQGLPLLATPQDIREFFSDCQIAMRGINIAHDSRGKPLGEGFVEFKFKSDFEKGIKKDKTSLGRHIVAVKPIGKKEMIERLGRGRSGGMPSQQGTQNQAQEDQQKGQGQVAQQIAEKSNGQNQIPPQNAQQGSQTSQGSQPGGAQKPLLPGSKESSTITAGGSKSIPPGVLNKNWYYVRCQNFPSDISIAEIMQFFQGFRPIGDSIRLHYSSEGKPTGNAVVGFASLEEAETALQRLNMRVCRQNIVSLYPA